MCNLISDILLCMSTLCARMFNFYLQQKVCESTDALGALLNAFEPEVGSSSAYIYGSYSPDLSLAKNTVFYVVQP